MRHPNGTTDSTNATSHGAASAGEWSPPSAGGATTRDPVLASPGGAFHVGGKGLVAVNDVSAPPTASTDPSSGTQLETARAFTLLREGVTQSGIDLFAAYGIHLCPVAETASQPPMAPDITYLAFVGFGGAHVSGFAIMSLPEAVLRRSNTTTSSLSDWVAELANQFLGRIKNRLMREGVRITRIPPAVVGGTAASLFLARGSPLPVALITGTDSIFIWTRSEPSIETGENADEPDPDVLAEGEMVLF